MALKKKALENIVGKGEMLVTGLFSLSKKDFFPIEDKIIIIEKFIVCKCFQFGRIQICVVWHRVNFRLL